MASDEIKDQYLSSSKAQLMLDWRPRLNLDDGLRVTHEWYERFFDGAAL
jgi:nucleoside-diphosphate-sugar epimerase